MAARICEGCGESFNQFGRGRPAKRCPDCRASSRYGELHQQLRAQTEPDAYGTPCVRCGLVMLEGQRLQLDHDDDDPTRYRGWAHGKCNERAGAINGNKARAAAYRAARGLSAPPAKPAAARAAPKVASNGGVILKPAAPTSGIVAEFMRNAKLEPGVLHGAWRTLPDGMTETYHEVYGWIRRRRW